MEENREKEFVKIIELNKLRKILSSCHLNFLFGAGVNGDLFPQMLGFKKTNLELKKVTSKLRKNYNFESELSQLNEDDRHNVLQVFVDEFNDLNKKIDIKKESYTNITMLFNSTFKMLESTENTIESMSKVNVFTFNYDSIVEEIVENEGYFVNVIKPSNLKSLKHHNVIVRNFETLRYIPSFVVSKLHGSIEKEVLTMENTILPGVEKYNHALNKDSFELLFKMKSELLKQNSVLLVIGYSWNDDHVNQILKDCVKSNLKIIWFKYDKKEKAHPEFEGNIIEIPVIEKKQDTTLTCSELFEVVTNV
ncbi:SIR2 family protein [Mycoplasmatota bacterium zrk1]